ncbi:MAG: peptide ABC transporter substrate-binding protein [Chloroflexi bacterium]|nr:peptide ABC transporter substrate-binding protein [Chloroflexota bacterium]
MSIGCVLDNTERQDAQPQSKNQSGQTEKTQGGQTGIGGDQTGTERPAQGKLRLYGFEPVTLDPAIVGDIGSYQYISQIFSGLVTIDENMRIAPDLAVGWTLSEDGKTYVFRLRQDAKFHNGTGVTADAFKYAIERATDPRTRSQIAQLYLGDIVGAMDKLSGKAQEVSGVRVKDPYNLEIEIDAPKSYFLAKLTYPTSYALDKNSVEGDRNWAKRPNGTGPFKLKSWQPDQSIVLQRNDLYYGKKASVAEVDFYLGGGSPVTMYERNEIDVASVSLADIDRVQDKKSPLNKELIVVPQLSLSYIGLNTTMKPFDDPKVRQAFAYATDKDKLANILFKKTRVTAKGILPPGMPGYNDQLSEIPFDPNRAKELIAQSSYGSVSNLPEITMTTSGGSLGESLAAMYKRNLGVDINVQQVDEAFHADLEARKYQMFFAGWIADYPDPQDFLDVLFHSQSNGNYTGFNDQQVDQLLEAARIEDDWPKSMTLYQRSEEQIVQQAPVVPLFHDVEYVLVKPRVKGFSISALGITALKNVELER